MEKKHLSKTVKTTTIKDGELIEDIYSESFVVDREPAFIKLYIRDIGKLNSITGKTSDVLLEFISHMGYNNVIPTYMPIKKMISKKVGCSLATVEAAVKIFKKKGLFIPLARGIYVADPELFGKGKWEDIKNLRLVIEYKQDGSKKLKSNLPEEIQLKLNM